MTVYTDMVADGPAAGFDAYLRAARACGDRLVVGVHGDDEAEWFNRRPGLTLEQRAARVASSRHVARVVARPPVFPTVDWIRTQQIDRVAYWNGLTARECRFWYQVPLELCIAVAVETPGHTGSDPHGRTYVPRADERTPRSIGFRVRRRIARMLPGVDRMLRRHAFAESLRTLADTLRESPLDARFWAVGGLLLGWARQGRILDSNLHDADFGYLDEDHGRFLAAVPSLARAGFRPADRFSSADGRYVEHRFVREGIQFDFFRLVQTRNRFRYSMFLRGNEPTELIAEVPAQRRVPFRYLDREWLKVADHDLALRSIYGDWRTDRPDWSFALDKAIVERVAMPLLPLEWNWPHAIVHGPGERDGAPGAFRG